MPISIHIIWQLIELWKLDYSTLLQIESKIELLISFFFCVKLTLLKIRQKFSILKVRLNCFIFTPKFHDLHGNELFHTNTFETFLDTFQPNFADILEFSPETQDKTNYESCKKKNLTNSTKFYFVSTSESVGNSVANFYAFT